MSIGKGSAADLYPTALADPPDLENIAPATTIQLNDHSKAKYCFGAFVIGVVGAMQVYAWSQGLNGTVFALTSLIIGSVTGAIFGFTYKREH